ncbi:MAG: hypothetical protein IJ773_02280 [Lachnospiraceae bacterium]|nr:hypothetical protein [Lachnospiraceae bacterium]
MKVRFVHNPDQDEPEVVITAKELTPQIQELMESLSGLQAGPVLAFLQEKAVLIDQESILRFYADGIGNIVGSVIHFREQKRE